MILALFVIFFPSLALTFFIISIICIPISWDLFAQQRPQLARIVWIYVGQAFTRNFFSPFISRVAIAAAAVTALILISIIAINIKISLVFLLFS